MIDGRYIKVPADHSRCPNCNQRPVLLCRMEAMEDAPMFYICNGCGYIGQVGRGEVQEEP